MQLVSVLFDLPLCQPTLKQAKIGCRLWNLSIVSVLILTFSNILLTVRLLHYSDCSKHAMPLPDIEPSHEDRELSLLKVPELPSSVVKANIGSAACKNFPNETENTSNRGVSSKNVNSVFQINSRLGRWDARHLFKAFDFAIVGDKFVALSERFTVCLATQSSLEKMHSLVQVAHHWSGAISAAIFAASDEFKLLEWYVGYLRKCFPLVRERVSFHLMFSKDRPPSNSKSEFPKKPKMDCHKPEAVLDELVRLRRPETGKWRVKNAYPQNHMRNLARRNCQSSHVFLTDVDIIPSARLAEGLDTFLRTNRCKGKCAYVIPTYEIDDRVKFPHNKTDLIRLAKKGLARPFHHKVFIFNQFATNFSKGQNNAYVRQRKTGKYDGENISNRKPLGLRAALGINEDAEWLNKEEVEKHIEHWLFIIYSRTSLVRPRLVRPQLKSMHGRLVDDWSAIVDVPLWQSNEGLENSAVHVSHNVTNFEFLYEPFYVAPDTVPAHDERFIGYGYTRNTQVYEMYVAGYQFQVLSPIFTCHWGLQNKKGRPSWRERQNSLNRRHFEVFKAEVFARYRKDPSKMVTSKKMVKVVR
uniref:Beta-1,4-glucuronyltransferase 1 n=1 Tax=Timema californicum TaxID=61474 RepID=A0A7R9J2A5_TIMCA|nr:unnamed protein product [Timema californicum]